MTSANMMRNLWHRDDFIVTVLFLTYCIVTGLVNPSFFSVGTLFDLARGAVVPGLLALGVLVVLIYGGIDVSFTAIAVLAMYTAVKLVKFLGIGDSLIAVFLIAAAVGLLLGLVNGFFIAIARLPTLIVTLGTLTLFRGFLLTFVGNQLIPSLPPALGGFSRSFITRIEGADGTLYSLPMAFLFLVIAAIVLWFVLTKTTLGRTLFAVGGSELSARRIGIRVTLLTFVVYGFVGLLSGIAGVVHASLGRVANPFDLVGLELSVLAAVVLGGARLSGGHGTIAGTLVGVAFVTVMNNTLITWGIPSTWQNIVVGSLILLGTALPAIRQHRKEFFA